MPFRHEALFYAGRDDFVRRTAAFLRDGVEAEEPALVVVDAAKIALLREELGDAAAGVRFADMAEVGGNPARIIPAWREFVTRQAPTGRRLRGLGEPIWPERTGAELAECVRHESLLNVAFAGSPSWWLVCPYDTEALEPAVLEEARRTHPFVRVNGVGRESDDYYGLQAIAAPFAESLPDPPESALELAFGPGPLEALRWLVGRAAEDAGLDELRAADLVLAVHELATNTVRHGGGRGTLRIWREPDALICEVADAGRIDQPLAGRERPLAAQAGGRGLWLVNQLCDLAQIRCFDTASVVRLYMRLTSAEGTTTNSP
jgi:anti-sigma regulatory factor (Ser/Thr protein kinase)